MPDFALLCTLQELLRYIKKSLGGTGKVSSVAVVAPGSKAGSVCEHGAEEPGPTAQLERCGCQKGQKCWMGS